MTKLTYDEYKKASEAGMFSGMACCCTGAIAPDEWCACSMHVLDMLDEDGQARMVADWRERGYKPRSEVEAEYAEEERLIEERKMQLNPLRRKRIERMKALGMDTSELE